MKVGVTAAAVGLDSPVDPRFGRCTFFVVVDTDTMAVESVANQSATAPGGAGIQAAQAVSSMGAKALITGNVGPNAMQTLSAAGIDVYQVQGGTVKDAVERFMRGELTKISAASVAPHSGMGRGGGAGGGRGRGQGAGGGYGGGKGQGQGGGSGGGAGQW